MKYFLFYYLNIDVGGGGEALSWYRQLVTTQGQTPGRKPVC